LSEYRTILTIPRTGEAYPEQINEYITNRANDMGLRAEIDSSGNVIVEVPATEGSENLPLTILQCHTDDEIAVSKGVLFNAEEDGILPDVYRDDGVIYGNGTSMGASGAIGIATILNVIQTSEQHGPLRAVFTTGKDGDMSGAKNLNAKYMEGHCLISLDGDKLGTVEVGAAYATTLRGDIDTTPVATQGRHAYVLVASGFPERAAAVTDADELHVNPMAIITQALSNARSAGILYELREFVGGMNALRIPGEATAIVVLNDYEEKKFLQIFEDVAKEYRNEGGDEVTIEMIETPVPDEVMSNEDADKALTFLFSFLSSDFSADTDAEASLCIGRVALSPGHFSCDISVQGRDTEVVDQIVAEQTNIEKLSGITITETGRIPGFRAEKDDESVRLLLESYGKALGEECKTANRATVSELGYLSEKNPDLQIMSIGITIAKRDTVNESIDRNTLATPANAILKYLNKENPNTT
jgi:dipeptidase D